MKRFDEAIEAWRDAAQEEASGASDARRQEEQVRAIYGRMIADPKAVERLVQEFLARRAKGEREAMARANDEHDREARLHQRRLPGGQAMWCGKMDCQQCWAAARIEAREQALLQTHASGPNATAEGVREAVTRLAQEQRDLTFSGVSLTQAEAEAQYQRVQAAKQRLTEAARKRESAEQASNIGAAFDPASGQIARAVQPLIAALPLRERVALAAEIITEALGGVDHGPYFADRVRMDLWTLQR
jgi:hypothetical protein